MKPYLHTKFTRLWDWLSMHGFSSEGLTMRFVDWLRDCTYDYKSYY